MEREQITTQLPSELTENLKHKAKFAQNTNDILWCKSCGRIYVDDGMTNGCSQCGTKLRNYCNCWLKNGEIFDCGFVDCREFLHSILEEVMAGANVLQPHTQNRLQIGAILRQ